MSKPIEDRSALIREGSVCKWIGPDQRTGETRAHVVVVAYPPLDGTACVQDEVGYMVPVSTGDLFPLSGADA